MDEEEWLEELANEEEKQDVEDSTTRSCLECGKGVQPGEDFDTEYCAAKWAEEHQVPYLEERGQDW